MKKIFISFAVEDKHYRDLLRGQSLNTASKIEYTDFSIKEPFQTAWKTNCRDVIKTCDGVIALISKKTRLADGAKWEMKCAERGRHPHDRGSHTQGR